MTHPDCWMRIKQVAEQRRDVSARGLARLMTRVREAQQKLQLLHDYRCDYRARFETAARAGMRGAWLRDYQTFILNLEQAIEFESQVVSCSEKRFTVAHRCTRDGELLLEGQEVRFVGRVDPDDPQRLRSTALPADLVIAFGLSGAA